MNADPAVSVRSRHVVLLTGDPIGECLGGAAVRSLEIARALGEAGHRTSVVTPALLPGAAAQPFPIRPFDRARAATVRDLLGAADVAVLPLHALVEFPVLARLRLPLVFDLYDPFAFELLHVETDRALAARRRRLAVHAAILRQVLARGDFFLCASERQRDLWLGALLAVGRIVPSGQPDPGFRDLIDVVPFGLPSEPAPPASTTRRLLGAVAPAIREGDSVLVWGGGIWTWLDPLTLIRALALVAERRAGVHLLFLGTSHPAGSDVGASALGPARELARALGLEGRRVHFREGWVPYAERGAYLAECAAGVTTHSPHLESRYAFRTRALDYLWAGLPIICTEGDVLAEMVQRDGLGLVVAADDPGALADAIERMVSDGGLAAACRARIAAIRPTLTWTVAVKPLVRFCGAPSLPPPPRSRARKAVDDAWQTAVSARDVLAAHGVKEVLRRIHRALVLRG